VPFPRDNAYNFGDPNREVWIGSPGTKDEDILLNKIMDVDHHHLIESVYFGKSNKRFAMPYAVLKFWDRTAAEEEIKFIKWAKVFFSNKNPAREDEEE
jgi:hypothetical protein